MKNPASLHITTNSFRHRRIRLRRRHNRHCLRGNRLSRRGPNGHRPIRGLPHVALPSFPHLVHQRTHPKNRQNYGQHHRTQHKPRPDIPLRLIRLIFLIHARVIISDFRWQSNAAALLEFRHLINATDDFSCLPAIVWDIELPWASCAF